MLSHMKYLRNFILYLLFFSASLFAQQLFAQQAPQSTLSVSPVFHYFNYTEYDDNNVELDRETGLIPGLELSFLVEDRRIRHSFEIVMSMINGRVDYDGQTQAGVPFITKTDETLYQLGFRYGWRTESPFIPEKLYIAVNHHRWDRDIIGKGNVQGLSEVYEWGELSLGLIQPFYQNNQTSLLIDASVLYIFGPEIEVDLSDFGFGKPVLELGARYGGRIQLLYKEKKADDIELSVSMYLEGWRFGRSNSTTIFSPTGSAVITEPKSETLHSGIRFTIQKLF